METNKKLEKLIKDLINARQRALPNLKKLPAVLGKPASPQQLLKLKNILGKPIPPSYRAFLELHNGWSKFSGNGNLLSIEDQTSRGVKEQIKRWNKTWNEVIKEASPFKQGMVPIMLGANRNFLVVDPKTAKKNGEMDFIDYDNGAEYQRHKDFTGFLKNHLKVLNILARQKK